LSHHITENDENLLPWLQLPPLFNLPKSQLQCYGESVYCTGSDLLSKCNNGDSPIERFISVVAWSISTTRPVTFGVAPYNPVLGETHHVSKGNLNVLLEQVHASTSLPNTMAKCLFWFGHNSKTWPHSELLRSNVIHKQILHLFSFFSLLIITSTINCIYFFVCYTRNCTSSISPDLSIGGFLTSKFKLETWFLAWLLFSWYPFQR